MNPIEQYIHDRDEQISMNMGDIALRTAAWTFTNHIVRTNYVKNFTWMGIPILQYTTDLMVMQELIFQVQPDVIIETGVAFGGMTAFYASLLEVAGHGAVYGIDIDIRDHAHEALSTFHHACLRQGDSISEEMVNFFNDLDRCQAVLVSLDSDHTHAHVLRELELYAPLVSVGSYIVVFDTAIEFFGHLDVNQNRPWGKGNNPWTAVQEFIKTDIGKCFVIDKEVENRALITSAIDGWLRRVK